ncbi:hypothetical protein QYF61_026602 [Mycteria americana]|uniref:Uncharacterized protein n=1 Tax=Mycteria americana TaxID=33587 RepID=A0AAN7NYP2_MYCAM|nr:hypothetical protein QYF61_026602 [Mycteria americana]
MVVTISVRLAKESVMLVDRSLLLSVMLRPLYEFQTPICTEESGEVKFPNIQSKPPLVQLEAISSRPITCYLGEETDPHLATASFQGVVESDKVSPQPPFLQAEQPQFPQPLLIRLLLQTLHQLPCPSLDTLQHLNVSLGVRGPKLNTGFEVRPHQCRVQGHDHFPSPAGHTISDTSQDAIGFLGHLGTLLAHIQAAVNQHPQVLFCQAAFQPLFPKPVALHGVVVAQVQDLALGLVEPHTIGLGPSIQPVQVPLQSLPTLKQINTPAQLGVICKLTEGALDPLVQVIDKDIKQNWPQHRALGNTACDRPPTGVNSIHHHSLGPAIQPVLYPVYAVMCCHHLPCTSAYKSCSTYTSANECGFDRNHTAMDKNGGKRLSDLLPVCLMDVSGECTIRVRRGPGLIKLVWDCESLGSLQHVREKGKCVSLGNSSEAGWQQKCCWRYASLPPSREMRPEQTSNCISVDGCVHAAVETITTGGGQLQLGKLAQYVASMLELAVMPSGVLSESKPFESKIKEEMVGIERQVRGLRLPKNCNPLYQHLHVFLGVRGPKLNTVFEVRPHQCRVQGHDHIPSPAGHTISDTSQEAVGFLGHLGTLLAHIQAAVNQHPQVLFCQAAFQPLFPRTVALHGVAVAQVQDLALGLVEPHTIGLGPSIQPVQVPLQSLPTLKQINTPTQLGVICKLTEGALDPLVQIIDKDIKQNWPQHRALGNTTCDRPPTGIKKNNDRSLWLPWCLKPSFVRHYQRATPF